MALFIARLMREMDPMADGTTAYGYTPDDVKPDDESDPKKVVGAPFTDLDLVTKEAYDAITALWELGVASGINATSYVPEASIIRAHMAEFMAGVLDHSNARPAGVTMQASKTWDFGNFESTIAVSYRDDEFGSMVDVSVKTFDSDTVGAFDEDGGCEEASDCAWTDDEDLTDASGNIYLEEVGVDDGGKNTYYAWMGDPEAKENNFNVNTSAHASVTLSSTTDATKLKVTSDISEHSTTDNTVDIDSGDDVKFTVQLIDDGGANVAKSGVKITVELVKGVAPNVVYSNENEATLTTDDSGQATFTTSGPKSTDGIDADRTDTVTFKSDVDESGTVGNPDSTPGAPAENVAKTILWKDEPPVLTTAVASVPAYVVISDENVTIRASVKLYDQYGNTAGRGRTVNITFPGDDDPTERKVSSSGVASYSKTVPAGTAGTPLTMSYAVAAANDSEGNAFPVPDVTGGDTVLPLGHAADDSQASQTGITGVFGDDNRFHIEGALYTYDSDDLFIDGTADGGGDTVQVDKFETLIGVKLSTIGTPAQIQVIRYDDDGLSIFRVASAAS
ncbi:MAG: hypothetical protein F4Y97_04540 [Dehalococcoidia bacterium]|nr:hypothetical protein [Dehalococcoidia bacterium]